MKAELSKLIKKYYKNLTEIEIEELANQLCDLLPRKAVKLSEIKVDANFIYKGYEFTKLADENGSCYCLLNDTVFESKFGDTNDWAKSPIRRRLNEFDGQGNSKAIKGISINDLVDVSLNYTAYRIPNGRTKDRITILSYEEYGAYEFEPLDKTSWLRSGYTGNSSSACRLNTSGGSSYSTVAYSYAVRPALHFKSDLQVEVK